MKRDSSQTATRNCGFTNSKPANSVWSSDMRNRRSTGVCGGSFSLVNCESKCDTSRDDFCTGTVTVIVTCPRVHYSITLHAHASYMSHAESTTDGQSTNFGLYGGCVCCRRLQSTCLKNACSRMSISSFGPPPSRCVGSRVISYSHRTSHIYYLLDSTALVYAFTHSENYHSQSENAYSFANRHRFPGERSRIVHILFPDVSKQFLFVVSVERGLQIQSGHSIENCGILISVST